MIARLRLGDRRFATRIALLALILSAALQYAFFLRWPGAPMFDLGYSILAAQNLLGQGKLVSLNMLAQHYEDLARAAELRWLVHFPPGQSLLYAAAMSLGLSAGAATKLLVLLGILVGGAGWIALARLLGMPPVWQIVAAVAYPWLTFTGSAYLRYETEHVAGALMPWLCLALLRTAPFADRPARHAERDRQAHRLAAAVALAALLVTFKYSMSCVLLASGLFLVAMEGRQILQRPLWWKLVVVALMVAPLLLALLVNYAYGPRATDWVRSQPLDVLAVARNLIENSVATPLGLKTLAARVLRGAYAPAGRLVVDLLALAVIVAFALHLRRRPMDRRLQRFALLLALLTATLWLSLIAASLAGNGQWNFSADARLYMPVVSMWLLFALVVLARLPARGLVRSPAFALLAIPVAAAALLTARDGLIRHPYPAMPRSQLAWTDSPSAGHARFLADFARTRRSMPDLMIGPSALMNEIEVPSMSNGYFVPPGHRYRSSEPIEVWALVWPSQQDKLLANFSAARQVRVATPPDYPFAFYIFRLGPTGASGPGTDQLAVGGEARADR